MTREMVHEHAVRNGNWGAKLRLLTTMVVVHETTDLILWNSLVAMASKVWHVPWRDSGAPNDKHGIRVNSNKLGNVDVGRRWHAMVIERDKRKPPWHCAVAA